MSPRHHHITHAIRERELARRQELAAIAAIALLLAITAFVFLVEGGLGTPGYPIRAVFASANGIAPGSPVRISGVDVGTVTGLAPGADNTTVISMKIDQQARPVHSDATLSILPRLILEGSFYINLEPGSPSAPVLPAGGTIPERDTAIPVQFDQFLDVFTSPIRFSLQQTLKGFSEGFGGGGTGAHPSGADGFRATVRAFARYLPSMGIAARASRGTSPNDLSRMITSLRDFTTGLAANPPALSGLVDHFDRLMGDIAAENRPLAAGLDALDATLREAPPELAALNAALPTVGPFSHAIDPALRNSPRALDEGTALLAQLRAISRPGELPTLLHALSPLDQTLPGFEREVPRLDGLTTPADRCISNIIVPTANEEMPDGSLSTGDPAWLDLFHAISGITAVTGGFDGNGSAIRIGLVGSASEFAGVIPGLGAVAGIGPTLEGVRPEWLGYGVDPAFRPDVWCDTQARPDLAARSGPAPALTSNPLPLGTSLRHTS